MRKSNVLFSAIAVLGLSFATISPSFAATSTSATVNTQYSTTSQLPPGVKYDPAVKPLAKPTATYQQKLNAVLKVAENQLGKPYRWGHNPDRGQVGFDCSNFTAYVYHHALGYQMSGASKVQYKSVGRVVPKSEMRPGDLVIFDKGKHVGIYAGNGRMIQAGGGLGKVGYLKLAPGSYWYKHITVVKRMF